MKAFRGVRDLKRGRRSGIFDLKLQERIMLAVTGVNKCALCSYAHASMALEAGLPDEEIRALAAGDVPDVPADEAKAVLFAQHYADSRGRPDEKAWNAVVEEYGIGKALCVLAAARMIMFGNATGIILGSIRTRLKTGHGDPRCGFLYELLFVLSVFPMVLAAILEAAVLNLFGARAIKFPRDKKPDGEEA